MEQTRVEVYALAVCFAALGCFVIALGIGIYDLIQIAYPEFTMSSYTYERHQSNEAFTKHWSARKPLPAGEELTKLREDSFQAALRSEKRSGLQSLVWVLIIMLIDAIVFAIHWVMGKRLRSGPATS